MKILPILQIFLFPLVVFSATIFTATFIDILTGYKYRLYDRLTRVIFKE